MMTPEQRKMKAMRAARTSALRQAVSIESKDYYARASQAARMTMLSLEATIEGRRAALAKLKVEAMEATARAEGFDSRCDDCGNYYAYRDEDYACPLCGCTLRWSI